MQYFSLPETSKLVIIRCYSRPKGRS